MSEFPKELKYADSHEWVREDGNDEFTVGITDFAQEQLGDVVFVDLPEVGDQVDSGDEVVVVESVKTAADVYAPMTGKIIEVNEALRSEPSLINGDAYGEGWLFRVKAEDVEELDSLLDADAYEARVTEE